MMRNAKAMVARPAFRSKQEKPKRGKGAYTRHWAADKPSPKQINDYRGMMDDLAKAEDESEDEADTPDIEDTAEGRGAAGAAA